MKNDMRLSTKEIDYILSPLAIRDRANKIFELTKKGKTHFTYHPEAFQSTLDYVLKVIYKNYPDLNIPFHSRWGHFRVGGVDRAQVLSDALSEDKIEKARSKLDLVITSVLLDDGAGPTWQYNEKESGKTFSRSEGLGVASYYLFLAGKLSSDPTKMQADSEGLKNLKAKDIETYFQVSANNPLVGVDGRVQLLNNLGDALTNTKIFKDGRPGNIIDYLIESYGGVVPATAILRAVLDGLGPIWPGRIQANGINLGDVWSHKALGSGFESLVPIHKLSQWMTYSLIEPIIDAGIKVEGVENLTGLAEYRNGGLFIDSGLLSFKDPKEQLESWAPSSEVIIEWRALTVHLLDQIGLGVQKALDKEPKDFPL
ncbi:MAG: DUF1688 family protein, partial [Bdellovibrionales bacterium]|nr:DUF1688 family protein [Bdellovibrionales bacterium]